MVVEGLCHPVEEVRAALVMYGRVRHPGLDPLDPATVHDLVIGGGSDGHRPTEMMGFAEAHATDCASVRHAMLLFV